jgi:hypothetical protein
MNIKKILTLCVFCFSVSLYAQTSFRADSLRVEQLNKFAEKIRQVDPNKSLSTAEEAFRLAKKIDFELGMAEAYRLKGIGYAVSLPEDDKSLAQYLQALTLFKKHGSKQGEAIVYVNIGNLYKSYDRKKALTYYYKAIDIAKKAGIEEIVAGCSINIADIFTREKKYSKALVSLSKSYEYFSAKKDTPTITIILANTGYLLSEQNKTDEAILVFNKCKEICIKMGLQSRLTFVNLNLADIYIREKKYEIAEQIINEGLTWAREKQKKRGKYNFLKEYYYLEKARGAHSQALKHLETLYRQDSVSFRELVSKKYTLHKEQYQFLEKQKQTEILLEKQKRNKVIIVASAIVLLLSFVVITLLVVQSRKKAKTLKKMQELNEEISLQKEELNKVNQNLESIIEERTQDLQVKNLKLSQYSSHLSHEIRSPISTIKGLLILDDEDLIDDQELIGEVKRCVEEIDNKLLNINQMLHNPQYKAFLLPENKNGGIITPPSNPPTDEGNT